MTTVLGNNVHCFLDGTEVFCAKDCVLTENKDTVEMAGGFGLPGQWTYNRLVRRGWQVDVSGFTKVDSTDGQLDYFSIVADPFATDFHALEITWEADGVTISFTGTVFIPKSSISGPVKEFAGGQVSFIGTGAYQVSNDPDTSGSGSGGGDVCVPVASGSFDPPDGTLNSAYSYTLPLTGTAPFTLGAVTGKPAWMTISVSSGNLVLGGTPTNFSYVTTFTLDITINNACGSIEVTGDVQILEDGRNVFVINNSSSDITLTNSNGHSYTFLASNGSDGNIKMQTSSVHIVTVTGTKNFTFLQSLPSTIVNSGTFTSGVNITTSNLSITNYLRFS